jgi:hypothetical protein
LQKHKNKILQINPTKDVITLAENWMVLLRHMKGELNKHNYISYFWIMWFNSTQVSILIKFTYRFNEALWQPVFKTFSNDPCLPDIHTLDNALTHYSGVGLHSNRIISEIWLSKNLQLPFLVTFSEIAHSKRSKSEVTQTPPCRTQQAVSEELNQQWTLIPLYWRWVVQYDW